jgi:hypothetical protein
MGGSDGDTGGDVGHEIGRRDPLGADAVLPSVPAMNRAADVGALVSALHLLAPDEARVAGFDRPACLAAVRDLGILLGSIRRHGFEPLGAAPSVEAPLLLLGQRTAMVPRDTVYHYGPWNPPGPRQRMYTGEPDEDVLIHSVRSAAPALAACIASLADALDLPLESPAFVASCDGAAARLQAMIQAVDFVRDALTPLFFARSLRPYFEAIVVGGRSYLGPAAANLPVYLVDHLLWSSDRPEPEHHAFQREASQHAPAGERSLFARREGQPSLSTRVAAALRATPGQGSAALRASAEAVCGLLRVLTTFRGRHLVLARREYAPDVRLYAAGSGGGTVELLAKVLALTRLCAASMHVRRTDSIAPLRAAPGIT